MLEREEMLDAFLKTVRLEGSERAFVDQAVRRAVRRHEPSSWIRWAACAALTLLLGAPLLKEAPAPAAPGVVLSQFAPECYGPEPGWVEPEPAGMTLEIEFPPIGYGDPFTNSLIVFAFMEDAARAYASDNKMAALALYEIAASFELPSLDPWRPHLEARIESLRS